VVRRLRDAGRRSSGPSGSRANCCSKDPSGPALSVLSNAVLVWNSVQFAEIVEGLEVTTGKTVDPLAGAHVIPSGTYRFPKAARGLE
jgi:hypothetical protein